MRDSMEERFRKVLDYSNDAIFIIEPAKNAICEANPKACAMLEYSRKELLSLPLSALYAKDSPGVLTFAKAVFEYGQGWTNEITFATKTGQCMPAEISAASIEAEGALCLLVLVRDASAIKQVEAALRKTSDELEQVVEEKTAEIRRVREILQEQTTLRSVAETALRRAEKELRKFQKLIGNDPPAGPSRRR